MRTSFPLVALLVAVTLILPTGCVGPLAASPGDGWIDLTGADLQSEWIIRGGKATYRVENGEIVGTTAPNTPNTFLCTRREFADFTLEYEFKVDPRLNSGVQIRSNTAPGYQDGRVHGYQVEIDPTPRAQTAGIYDEARRGWLDDLKGNAAAKAAFRPEQWNQVRVEARGPEIRTWLNGVAAANLHDELTRRGFIALQVHSTSEPEPLEVRWRKIRVFDGNDPWEPAPAGAMILIDREGRAVDCEPLAKPGGPVPWKTVDGALEIEPGTGNIASKGTLDDCRIHVEFCVDENGKPGQANGNSGVYIQNRYEVQILNSAGQPPANNICGAIYGVRAPDYNLALRAGEWQRYDIWFRAARFDADGRKTENARITVYHNGTRIHHDVEIPDKTGGGSPEGPTGGPIALQDHGNRIRFRNVWVQQVNRQ
ncbi:MAG: hypothetical protein AMXMBFR47_24930 [Planctomycetota bacterium]